jgi:eukaryotic-like serine/threonine-protein kinase
MNIGQRVGDYEIVQILGAGGMGQVYKVRNVFSDRIEAMKVLLPNLGGDNELAERFQREIKVQAALDHPNIARLNTAQLVGNQLIMVMEYVEGQSVETLLRHGPLPLQNALSCMVQVLDALAYAHARGVVHRDIKPPNIMLTPQGVAKLMDFGIARMEQDRRLTQTGHAVGSLFYMSPEQIKGVQPDARSDIYSLGITMYEMVTGRRPFEGTSDFSIMAAHLEQKPVAPIEVIPGVPTELSDIILMAIAKDPVNRFQSAAAFHAALKSLTTGLGPGGTLMGPAVVPPPVPAVPPTVVNTPVSAPPPPLPFQAQPVAQPVQAAPPPFTPQPAYPPPAPPPYAIPPASQKFGRRGLYMALGSVATLLVLAAAVVEGPKLWHSGAAINAPDSPSQNPVSGAVQPPSGSPSAPVGQAPASQAPASQPPVSQPSEPVAVQPVPIQPRPIQAQPIQVPPIQPPPSSRPVAAQPVKQQNPVAQQPVLAPPAQQQPPPVQVQPLPQQQPAAQAQQAPPVPSGPSPQQMNEVRQQYNLLAVRVGAAKSGLGSIQQQMRRQGLDLRTDIVEAESRMDYLMKEAMDSIRANDPASAKSEMQMAELALGTVEKFLGR